MAQQKLYEVQVGYRDDIAGKDRWLGVWTGLAASDSDAHAKAHEAEWDARLDSGGASAVYATRVKPRYVIAEHWGHLFVGKLESITRWAYDRVAEKLVYAEIQTNGKWSALTVVAMDDLTESIHDNDANGEPQEFELEEVDALPSWVTEALEDAADVAVARESLAEIDSGSAKLVRGAELEARLAAAGASGKRKAKP